MKEHSDVRSFEAPDGL